MRSKETWSNKKKNKAPEKELNKMEISNLSNARFKTLVLVYSRN